MNRQVCSFLEDLRQRCQAAPGRIGFPDSDDARIWAVTDRLLAEGAVREVLYFTPEKETRRRAGEQGIDLARHGSRLKFPLTAPLPTSGRLAAAASLLAQGDLDAALAGNIATTAEVIRAGLGGVGLASGVRTVSGSFIMNRPGEALHLYADCGVVITPTVRQLVDIALESVRTWRLLVPSVEPALAFLSFSTKGSANHEAQARMAEAAALFRAEHPDVASDGELQFDAALDPEIGQRKAPGSAVAGRANCFIFPSLDAGNIAYKITQRLAGYEAYGPILQGLAKPFSDLSRGSTVNDILASAYVNLQRVKPA